MPIDISSSPEAPKNTVVVLKKHFLISLVILAAVVLGALGLGSLVPRGPKNAIEGAKATLDYAALENEYKSLIPTDFFNLENHRDYLQAHLSIPKVRHTRHSTIVRNDQGILDQYNEYTHSNDPAVRDVGYYGLGYFYTNEKQAAQALENFGKIANRDLPYLNNTIGFLYLSVIHRSDLAQGYFYKEIALKGNLKAAVANLAQLFWESRKLQELDALSQDANLAKYFPLPYLRYLELAEHHYDAYFASLVKSEAGSVSWISLLPSLAIALMFLVYIYFIDTFERERISLLLGVFGMGILSAALCTALYDLAGCYLGFKQTGDEIQNLVFFIFGVGLIEETVKVLPVLIAVYAMRKWNESVDIFVFACVSALGFACLENTGYFSRVAIGLIMGRTLSAVALHVCLTSLAVYGIFYNRYKPSRFGFLYLFGCFGAAVLAHGLYDFFISSSLGLGIASTLILILMMLAFRNMLENALDQSEFAGQAPLTLNLSYYLFYGLLCILLMQFCILAVQYGPEISLKNLGKNVFGYYFLAIILITDFGKIQVVKNRWRSLLDRS